MLHNLAIKAKTNSFVQLSYWFVNHLVHMLSIINQGINSLYLCLQFVLFTAIGITTINYRTEITTTRTVPTTTGTYKIPTLPNTKSTTPLPVPPTPLPLTTTTIKVTPPIPQTTKIPAVTSHSHTTNVPTTANPRTTKSNIPGNTGNQHTSGRFLSISVI